MNVDIFYTVGHEFLHKKDLQSSPPLEISEFVTNVWNVGKTVVYYIRLPDVGVNLVYIYITRTEKNKLIIHKFDYVRLVFN